MRRPPARASAIVAWLASGLALAALAACPAPARPPHPVDTCAATCAAKAGAACSEAECARGCELVLDRVVERQAEGIVACVARSRRRCTDAAWAECAALVGPHADGGPPPLPPPDDFE